MAATANATATKARKPTPAKKVSQAKPVPPPKAIAQIYLIALNRIQVDTQVRTLFDEASIAELAADIEARGLRAPVEVTPIGDELYRLTLGERRLRAVRLLGHQEIPAIIVPTSDENRLLDQLAENIQREQLDLEDLVKAVRQLHDKLQSCQAVAEHVKKSKTWVSKHLALSHPDLRWEARQLLADGVTEDVELLYTLSQLAQISYAQGAKLAQQIRAGQAGREQARKMLTAAKAEQKKAKHAADQVKPAAAPAAKEPAPLVSPKDTAEDLLWVLNEACIYPERETNEDPVAILNLMSAEQREDVKALLLQAYNAATPENALQHFNTLFIQFHRTPHLAKLAAILGLAGVPFDLYAFVTVVHAANRQPSTAEREND